MISFFIVTGLHGKCFCYKYNGCNKVPNTIFTKNILKQYHVKLSLIMKFIKSFHMSSASYQNHVYSNFSEKDFLTWTSYTGSDKNIVHLHQSEVVQIVIWWNLVNWLVNNSLRTKPRTLGKLRVIFNQRHWIVSLN